VSDLVTLTHPTLPADQTIQVERRRMGPRLAAGWQEVEAAAPEKGQSTKSTEPTESAPKRQRRNTTEEQ
jgi:hypothetical protein